MNLAKRSLESASFNIIANGVQAVIQFVRSILLARLLLPEQFGVYAYIFAIIKLSSIISNFGMNAALVHRDQQSQGEIAQRVHFTLTTIFTLFWALILLSVNSFLIDEAYRGVFLVILSSQIVDNFTQTPRAKLTREVNFRRIAILGSIDTFVGSAIAVLLAYSGAGIWSLVSTDVTTAVLGILGFYIFSPIWLPRFGWSGKVARYLLDFGRRSFSAMALLQALDRVDDLWVGIFLGETALGYYSRAFTFATYPRKLLAAPLNQVATGTYAALKEKPKQLSQAFFRVNAFLIRSGFLFAGLFFLLIPEFIHYIIGDKWLPLMTPFRLMLVYTLLDPIKITIANVFFGIGEPEKVVRIRAYQLVVLVIGLFTLGPWLGINGVAIAANVMLIFGIIMLFWKVRPYVDFSLRILFLVPLIVLGLGITITLGLNILLFPSFSVLGVVILKILSFIIIYLGLLLIIEYKSIKNILSSIKISIFQSRNFQRNG